MIIFFDYIFYRIAQINIRKDFNFDGRAVIAVSLLQAFFIQIFLSVLLVCFFAKQDILANSKLLCVLAGIIFILLIYLNYKRYNGKYEIYQVKWGNENIYIRIFKGVVVILCYILIPISLFILSRYLHK